MYRVFLFSLLATHFPNVIRFLWLFSVFLILSISIYLSEHFLKKKNILMQNAMQWNASTMNMSLFAIRT